MAHRIASKPETPAAALGRAEDKRPHAGGQGLRRVSSVPASTGWAHWSARQWVSLDRMSPQVSQERVAYDGRVPALGSCSAAGLTVFLATFASSVRWESAWIAMTCSGPPTRASPEIESAAVFWKPSIPIRYKWLEPSGGSTALVAGALEDSQRDGVFRPGARGCWLEAGGEVSYPCFHSGLSGRGRENFGALQRVNVLGYLRKRSRFPAESHLRARGSALSCW